MNRSPKGQLFREMSDQKDRVRNLLDGSMVAAGKMDQQENKENCPANAYANKAGGLNQARPEENANRAMAT